MEPAHGQAGVYALMKEPALLEKLRTNLVDHAEHKPEPVATIANGLSGVNAQRVVFVHQMRLKPRPRSAEIAGLVAAREPALTRVAGTTGLIGVLVQEPDSVKPAPPSWKHAEIAANAPAPVALFAYGVAGQNVRTRDYVHQALCKFKIAGTVVLSSEHARTHAHGMIGIRAPQKGFAGQERLIAKHVDSVAPRSKPVAIVANGTSLAAVRAKAFAPRERPPMNPLAVATAAQRRGLAPAMRLANGRIGANGHCVQMKAFVPPVIQMLRVNFAGTAEPKNACGPVMVFANGVDGASGTSAKMRENAP